MDAAVASDENNIKNVPLKYCLKLLKNERKEISMHFAWSRSRCDHSCDNHLFIIHQSRRQDKHTNFSSGFKTKFFFSCGGAYVMWIFVVIFMKSMKPKSPTAGHILCMPCEFQWCFAFRFSHQKYLYNLKRATKAKYVRLTNLDQSKSHFFTMNFRWFFIKNEFFVLKYSKNTVKKQIITLFIHRKSEIFVPETFYLYETRRIFSSWNKCKFFNINSKWIIFG